MSDEDRPTPDRLPWHWDWVPRVDAGESVHAAWRAHLAALFADWTAEGLEAVRAAWAEHVRAASAGIVGPEPQWPGAEFPLTADMVGRGAADWLMDRARQLPAWSRLAWGAAFVDGRPRWAPVPVVVEFCRPTAEDPNYLMALVGAGGLDGDARPPVVDYVTTALGDGVRVFALGRTPEGAAFGRVDAAMRLEVPPSGTVAGVGSDVLLSTRVFEMGLMPLIGTGVEQLMQQLADECTPGAAGPARFALVPAAEEAPA
ncbi:hypothetical protein ABH931_004116 [Streptacidiphilus sp. MAP12-33]|uniref:hypothetical protein n=1 Tax=Streptacidiphilus sp. MAP12-33 TaxID=3156266 RepID=UPI0035112AAA